MWFIIKLIEHRFDRTEFQTIFKQKYVMSLKYTVLYRYFEFFVRAK